MAGTGVVYTCSPPLKTMSAPYWASSVCWTYSRKYWPVVRRRSGGISAESARASRLASASVRHPSPPCAEHDLAPTLGRLGVLERRVDGRRACGSPASSAASGQVELADTDLPKYVRAAASTPNAPCPK